MATFATQKPTDTASNKKAMKKASDEVSLCLADKWKESVFVASSAALACWCMMSTREPLSDDASLGSSTGITFGALLTLGEIASNERLSFRMLLLTFPPSSPS
jgi:hypothetical protein